MGRSNKIRSKDVRVSLEPTRNCNFSPGIAAFENRTVTPFKNRTVMCL